MEVGLRQDVAPHADEVIGDFCGRLAIGLVDEADRVRAGQVDGLGDELVLAVGEVVVDRAAGCAGEFEDLGERGLLESAFGEQACGAGDHAPPSVACHPAVLSEYVVNHSFT